MKSLNPFMRKPLAPPSARAARKNCDSLPPGSSFSPPCERRREGVRNMLKELIFSLLYYSARDEF